MLKKPKVGVYLFDNGADVKISEFKKLVKFLERDYYIQVISELKLPSSINHTFLENALNSTYYFPFDVRIFFSQVTEDKVKDLTSKNLFLDKLNQDTTDYVKDTLDEYFFEISKDLNSYGLEKTLSICNFAESFNLSLLGKAKALNDLKQHSRILLLDGQSKRYSCPKEYLKVTDIIVLHDYIDVSAFDTGKPVVLYLSSTKPLEDLELTLRRDLLQSKMVQFVVTSNPKVRSLMNLHSIDVIYMDNPDPELLLKSLAKIYKDFNPKEELVIYTEHELDDKSGNRITIPSDICKSFNYKDLALSSFIEFNQEIKEYESYLEQEYIWRCWKIYQSCRLLSNHKILYIGENLNLVSYLNDNNFDVVFFYTGNGKNPCDKRKNKYKDISLCKDLFSIQDYNTEDRLVICDSVLEDYSYIDSLGLLNFIKTSGFKRIGITFKRVNNLFVNVNTISPYLSNLGFRLNGNGFTETKEDSQNSFIYLICD